MINFIFFIFAWMVEMDDGLYKVKLNNGLELEVTPYGQVIEIDH